jgi:hypothetical protein
MSYKNDGDDERADSKYDDAEERLGDAKADSKGESKGDIAETKLTAEEILAKVQEYFYCDDALANLFENFANEKSSVIDLSSDEYKLEYTEVFNEYKALFENKIESFLVNTLNCTVEDFYYALKAKTDLAEDSSESIFAQILIAVTDFDIFMTMMREAAVANSHK